MRRPGRKSAASLSIVPPWALQPPEPPRRLSREERTIWRELVAPFRADHFHGAEHLLEALVEAIGLQRFLDEQIKTAIASQDEKRLAALIVMQRHQTQAVGNLGRHPRVTPRSRYDRYSVRPTSGLPKPWDLVPSTGRQRDDKPDHGGSPFDAA